MRTAGRPSIIEELGKERPGKLASMAKLAAVFAPTRAGSAPGIRCGYEERVIRDDGGPSLGSAFRLVGIRVGPDPEAERERALGCGHALP
ncbi:MAG: hypothetical protein QOF51_53 [Chloroflexota bacterium]|jgi:hypothetical protein|nr:hypothetical protein [Chloroflexota bacterium]